MKKAVIILPTYNEKENIEKLIPILEKDIFPKISNYEMAILVADDNSPDGTARAAEELSKQYKNIAISSGPKNGLGAAYVRGMSYAIDKMSADVLFEMDADMQHDAKKIPEFLRKIDEGCDMVIGNRYSDGGSIPQNWPIQRKIFSIVANLTIRTIFMRFSIHDWTGGYRALKKEVFLKEKDQLTEFRGYTFQVSFLHKAVSDGFNIGEVPFHFSDRTLGDSKIAPMEYIVDLLSYVIVVRIKEIIFGKFGKFLVVGGIGFIINYVTYYILFSEFSWQLWKANLVGAAMAIFSNFNLNNLWTFSERRVKNPLSYFLKLLQFYLTSSFGVIFIQTGTIFLGEKFVSPYIDPAYETIYATIYFIIGTGFLLIWNFTVYNRIIWRKKDLTASKK